MADHNKKDTEKDEFNGAGNDELTAEDMNKRVEEEKARITKSHGGTEEAPIESQPLATEETTATATTTTKEETTTTSSNSSNKPSSSTSSFGNK